MRGRPGLEDVVGDGERVFWEALEPVEQIRGRLVGQSHRHLLAWPPLHVRTCLARLPPSANLGRRLFRHFAVQASRRARLL